MNADIQIIANAGAKGMTEQGVRDEFVSRVQRALPNANVVFADKQTPVDRLVKDAINSRATMIVAGGGDGTVNAVATALAGSKTVLGVLPLGTLNHFAKDLGLPDDIDEALAVLASGNITTVDVGRMNDRIFVNNSGLGLYPEMVFNREKRQRHGASKWAAAFIESVRVLWRYRLLNIEIEIDGKRVNRRTPAVFIGNNEYEFSATSAQQRQSLSAGMLCLYVPHQQSRLKLIWFVLRALFGNPETDADFDRFLARAFTITTSRQPLSVSLDGEVTAAKSPLRYESQPGALQVMVPAKSEPNESSPQS
ncbi:MAG: diacylglycerol kinase family lipid kinase [Gemmatimonadota bacterium]|nr:diacylglycerol kinase family lipid kinase [Gemmatimonadota bacterium]